MLYHKPRALGSLSPVTMKAVDMFGRRKDLTSEIASQQEEADAALEQAENDYQTIQSLRPEAEATVRGHNRLQLENHFSERMWLAYRGEQ
jgi:hypothetical protein